MNKIGAEYGQLPASYMKDVTGHTMTKASLFVFKLYLSAFGHPNVVTKTLFQEVSRILPPRSGERWLDAGCARGFLSPIICRASASYVGLEIQWQRAAMGQRLGRGLGLQANFVSGDIARLSFSAGCFDGVICLETLEHVPNDAKALAEFRRVMKPGARLILSVPIVKEEMLNAEQTSHAPEEHVRNGYVLERLQMLLNSQGFGRIDVRPWATPMFARIHKIYGRLGARSRMIAFPLLSFLCEVGSHRMAAYENVEGLDQRRYLLVVAYKD